MADEKIFADGFSFKRNDNAPEFVVGKQSIKVAQQLLQFMQETFLHYLFGGKPRLSHLFF